MRACRGGDLISEGRSGKPEGEAVNTDEKVQK